MPDSRLQSAVSLVVQWALSAGWTVVVTAWVHWLDVLKSAGGWRYVLAAVLTVAGKSAYEAVKKYFTTTTALALAALAIPQLSLLAQAPPSKKVPEFQATITRVLDGDTYVVTRDDGSEQKIRLHYADAPEVAHNSKEKDQPGGRESLDYVQKFWKGHKVKLAPRGKSYDRLVCDVSRDDGNGDMPLAIDLLSQGLAMLDPRYHPPEILRANQMLAVQNKKGIWSNTDHPTPPWEWRKKKRTREADWEFKSFHVSDPKEFQETDADCDHNELTEKKK